MRHLKYVLMATGLVLLTAFQCDDDCVQCIPLTFNSESIGFLPDSIVNLTERKTAWRKPLDTLALAYYQTGIAINPEKINQLLLFHHGSEVDTLVLRYMYEEYYDEQCGDYIFKLGYANLEYSSFKEVSLRFDECMNLKIEQK